MTINNRAQGVIFDMDGVLIDSAPAHKQSWFEVAAKYGYPMNDEIFKRVFGLQNPSIIAIMAGCELPEEKVTEMSLWKEERFREIFSETLHLSAGGDELLRQLKDEGFFIAIGSSAPKRNLDLVVDSLHLRDIFDAIVSQEDTKKGKPAPDTFLKAAEKLQLAPEKCVVVEDAVHGVQAGKAAGMAVVALTTTTSRSNLYEADYIVDSLSDLTPQDFKNLLADNIAKRKIETPGKTWG